MRTSRAKLSKTRCARKGTCVLWTEVSRAVTGRNGWTAGSRECRIAASLATDCGVACPRSCGDAESTSRNRERARDARLFTRKNMTGNLPW